MPRTITGLGLIAVLSLLAACDDSDSGGSSDAEGIETLGSDFVAAFRADPNSEPVDAQDVSLTLTPGIEPFDPN